MRTLPSLRAVVVVTMILNLFNPCSARTAEDDPLILKGHLGPVTGVVFSPDGKRLASGSHDQTVKV